LSALESYLAELRSFRVCSRDAIQDDLGDLEAFAARMARFFQ
jgi:hypothetical protein